MATKTAKNETKRLEARLSPEDFAAIKHAAERQGRSLSDFVVAASLACANETIAETEAMVLNQKASEQVAELLINPPDPTEAFLEAIRYRRKLIR